MALLEKGDEEKEKAKARFLKESRRARGIKEEPKEAAEAKQEGEAVAEEEEKAPVSKVPEDKLKIVEQIKAQKRRQAQAAARNAQRRGRRGEDDDGLDFGEEGIDIDTYESNYVPTQYTPGGEDDEGQGAAFGGPIGDDRKRDTRGYERRRDDRGRDNRDNRDNRGGKTSFRGARGSRGGRGGRGGAGQDNFERRDRSRHGNRNNNYENFADEDAETPEFGGATSGGQVEESKRPQQKKKFEQVFNDTNEFPAFE